MPRGPFSLETGLGTGTRFDWTSGGEEGVDDARVVEVRRRRVQNFKSFLVVRAEVEVIGKL